jgi:DNA-binding NarL/FixJ family response regulator
MVKQAESREPAARPVTVFLLDDHEVVRRGVRDLLEAHPDITVIGEASTASSALPRIAALRPDVAVLDVRLPDGDGVMVCREIRSLMPEVACLMLTAFSDDEALFDSIMAGAAGYMLKHIHGTDLAGAIRTIASGQSMLAPRAASQVMARLRDQAAERDPLAGAKRAREQHPGADRGRADQPGDRRAAVPGREDGQGLHIHAVHPSSAWNGAAQGLMSSRGISLGTEASSPRGVSACAGTRRWRRWNRGVS